MILPDVNWRLTLAIVTKAVLFAAVCLAHGHTSALADKRVALAIGNSAYRNVPQLANPVNDATAVTALLKSAGFDVVEARTDLGVVAMRRTISNFSEVASDADVAVVLLCRARSWKSTAAIS